MAGGTHSADDVTTVEPEGGTAAGTHGETDEPEIEARVGWRYTMAEVKRDPTAKAGLYIMSFMVAMATVAFVDAVVFDYLAEYAVFAQFGMEQYWLAKTVWMSPIAENAPELLPPVGLENNAGRGQLAHPLGTDHRGRDILLRVIYGSRIAIQVGIVASVIGLLGGTVVGAVAGYYGGWVDDGLMRAVEVLYSIPFLVFILALAAILGAGGDDLTMVTVAVGFVYIPEFARLIRSRVVSVREEVYVEAAKAAGVRDRNIIRRHVIPNSFTPVMVQGTLRVGTAIITVAGLAFLGVGVDPPTPSWGQMLSISRDYMITNLWFSVWPGLAILITVMGVNMFGDGLRDALDPRLKN